MIFEILNWLAGSIVLVILFAFWLEPILDVTAETPPRSVIEMFCACVWTFFFPGLVYYVGNWLWG